MVCFIINCLLEQLFQFFKCGCLLQKKRGKNVTGCNTPEGEPLVDQTWPTDRQKPAHTAPHTYWVTHTYTHTHWVLHTDIHTHTERHTHTHVHNEFNTHMHTHTECYTQTYTLTQKDTHTCAHWVTPTHTHTLSVIHRHIYTLTQKHTHTHVHTESHPHTLTYYCDFSLWSKILVWKSMTSCWSANIYKDSDRWFCPFWQKERATKVESCHSGEETEGTVVRACTIPISFYFSADSGILRILHRSLACGDRKKCLGVGCFAEICRGF